MFSVHQITSDSSDDDDDIEAVCRTQDNDEWLDNRGQRIESLKSHVVQLYQSARGREAAGVLLGRLAGEYSTQASISDDDPTSDYYFEKNNNNRRSGQQ